METSQNAGRPVIAGDPSGGWNVPPVKDFAEIEVTSANFSAVKLSHVPADADDTAATAPNPHHWAVAPRMEHLLIRRGTHALQKSRIGETATRYVPRPAFEIAANNVRILSSRCAEREYVFPRTHSLQLVEDHKCAWLACDAFQAHRIFGPGIPIHR